MLQPLRRPLRLERPMVARSPSLFIKPSAQLRQCQMLSKTRQLRSLDAHCATERLSSPLRGQLHRRQRSRACDAPNPSSIPAASWHVVGRLWSARVHHENARLRRKGRWSVDAVVCHHEAGLCCKRSGEKVIDVGQQFVLQPLSVLMCCTLGDFTFRLSLRE